MNPVDAMKQTDLRKILDLLPWCQWAAQHWINDCFNEGKAFAIPSAYRTAEQQHSLWQRGRDKYGMIIAPKLVVTYDDGYRLLSQHQQRLAVDVFPISCTYEDLAVIAQRYGIEHPWPLSKAKENNGFVDQPHFYFGNAMEMPVPIVDPHQRLAELERRIKVEVDPQVKILLTAEISNLKRRLNIPN